MIAEPNAAPTRIAVVGCGRIGRAHLGVLGGADGVVPGPVVDVDAAAADVAARDHGCEVLRSHDDPALAEMADAAVVCTPPDTHFEIAAALLERGLHVLCEKPLTLDPGDARRLVRLAEREQRVLMPATKFRFVPGVERAREQLRRGALGRIGMYRITFSAPVDMSGRWNAQPSRSGGGVLMDNGPHAIDLARWLLGPLTAVRARFGPRLQELPVEDSVHLELEGADGSLGIVELSWSLEAGADEFVTLLGERGTLHVGWTGARRRAAGGGDWQPLAGGYDRDRALGGQLAHFGAVVRGREAPRVTAADGAAAVSAVQAAYRSAADGCRVALGEPS